MGRQTTSSNVDVGKQMCTGETMGRPACLEGKGNRYGLWAERKPSSTVGLPGQVAGSQAVWESHLHTLR